MQAALAGRFEGRLLPPRAAGRLRLCTTAAYGASRGQPGRSGERGRGTAPRPGGGDGPHRPGRDGTEGASTSGPSPEDRRKRSLVLAGPRGVALQQLLRVERGGAYVGFVSGGKAGQASPGVEEDDLDPVVEEEGEAAGGEGGAGAGAADAAAAALPGRGLDPRDRRLAKKLVAGVTRWQRRLDYIMSQLTGQKSSDLEVAMCQVLRLGLYELTRGGMEPHALNEHVELAKAAVRPEAGGFANGVLRAAARRLADGTLPDPKRDLPAGGSARDVARRLAISHSHPTWMVARWVKRWGEGQATQLLEHNNRPPSYAVRVNRAAGVTVPQLLARLASLDPPAQAAPSRFLPDDFAVVTAGMQQVLASGLVEAGQAYVQDEATGLVVAMLDPQPGEAVLDACAAPGGKALYIATLMQGEGRLVAMDRSAGRLRALAGSAQAAGLAGALDIQPGDLRDFAAWAGARRREGGAAPGTAGTGSPASRAGDGRPAPPPLLYDRVLVDAPCSGTGVLAKRADLRWRRSPEDLEELCALQDSLLLAAASLVRPGGLLVYSTCSMEPEEHEGRVAALLEATRGAFCVEPPLPGRLPAEVLTPEGCLALLPHVHGTDGAFAVRLRRVGP